MAAINFKKDVLPHLIAVIVFVITTIIFYSPLYFEGEQIDQHDVKEGIGASQELVEYRERTGEEGLWTNSMFSGMPGYLVSIKWSGDLLTIVQGVLTLNLPGSSKITFLTMICFYIMLLCFKVRPYLAIVGAVAFGYTSYNIIGIMAGHLWRIVAVAYIPLVIAGVHLTFSGKRLLGFALTALAVGLEIKANHLQISYYLILMLGVYGLIMLIYAIKEGAFKSFVINSAIILFAGILGVGANIGRIWTVYEYSQYSMRGPSEINIDNEQNEAGLEREYVFRYSNSIIEPMVLFIPNFMGGQSQQSLSVESNLGEALARQAGMNEFQIEQQLQFVPTYWGQQPLTAPYYAGAIMFFLFVIGLFLVDRKIKFWLISMVVIGIILSWGSNFKPINYFLFDYFPLYDKFRSVTFTIIMSIIGIQLLAVLGVESWLYSSTKKEKQKVLFYSIAIVGGLLLLIGIFAGLGEYRAPIDEQLAQQVPQWFIEALRDDRASLLRTDAFRSLLFVILSAVVLWMTLRDKISLKFTLGLLILINFIDLGLVGNRYLNDDSYSENPIQEHFAKTEADEAMLAEPGHFRVLNLNNPFNEARTSYFYSSIGGYHGAKIRRYQDLIENCISPEINQLISTLRSGQRDFDSLHVLNMLNTRFFYAGETRNMVFRNEDAHGNAWLVNSVKMVENPTEELQELCNTETDETAVVNRNSVNLSTTEFDDTGSVELVSHEPNHLIYKANLNGPSLIVFSEIFYPEGWKVTVNNEEADYFRANYVLRAMELPSGSHTIEFKFEPQAYYTGNTLMLIFSGLIILVLIIVVIFEIRRKLVI